MLVAWFVSPAAPTALGPGQSDGNHSEDIDAQGGIVVRPLCIKFFLRTLRVDNFGICVISDFLKTIYKMHACEAHTHQASNDLCVFCVQIASNGNEEGNKEGNSRGKQGGNQGGKQRRETRMKTKEGNKGGKQRRGIVAQYLDL